MTISEVYKILDVGGITAPSDYLPPIFKTGGGLDSESTTITHKEKIRIKKDGTPVQRTVVDNCFCYAWQIALTPERAEIVRTPREICVILQTIIKAVQTYNKIHETNAKFIIWCANLAHEYAFLKTYLHSNFEITKMFAKSQRDVLYIELSECVVLRECIGLFGHSLNDIAKHWCNADNQKLTGTFDYNLTRTYKTPLTETERAYMSHDVTTLAEMHINVVKYHTQSNGVCVLPYTSSGFVRLKLKDYIRNDNDLTEQREHAAFMNKTHAKDNIHYLKKVNYNCVTDAFQWSICREYGYCGGLCGSNIDYAGEILHGVTCADLTSDYPAQMTHNLYPSGRLRRMGGNLSDVRKKLEQDKRPYFVVLHIHEIKAKTQHATISKHKIINYNNNVYKSCGSPRNVIAYNGKIHRAENIVICINDIDLKAYRELYTFTATIISLWAFDCYKRCPQWLLNAMWSDYEQKALLKIAGKSNTQEYSDSKRNLNSYYGVTAQRDTETLTAFDEQLNPCPEKPKTFDDIRRNFWLNPYIAFWTTSYARALLMHFIARYPDSIVQYDTDSLYYLPDKKLEKAIADYNKKIMHKNRVIFKDMPNAEIFETLGTWDIEDTYKKFLGMGAKKYIKEDDKGIKTVIAGLPKNAIPKEIEQDGINSPFDFYNPLVRYMDGLTPDIIIRHLFAGKFASVYDDTLTPYYSTITDYHGETCKQLQCSYHAIVPIDFTLSMADEYIRHILKRRE